jgi:hypothetical protein
MTAMQCPLIRRGAPDPEGRTISGHETHGGPADDPPWLE